MKKLGQKPDSYTITILLRGYKLLPQGKSSSLFTALNIYDSMFKPNSPVKPQIIHSNAMLEACAREGDIEAMFSVAARLNESGVNSPDDITYTIIFNAIANTKPSDKEERQRLISHARRIWVDVLKCWKSGRLVMNEILVCSLGRVLFSGRRESDLDDIFSLIQQTMRIPRQFERLVQRGPARETGKELEATEPDALETVNQKDTGPSHVQEDTNPEARFDLNALFDDGKQSGSQGLIDIDASESDAARPLQMIPKAKCKSMELNESSKNTVPKPEFDVIETAGLVFGKPGNITLSLLVNTCASLKKYDGGKKYWDLLTQKITPDTLNYVNYMKLLKEAYDHSAATDLLREVYKASKDRKRSIQMNPILFWHAMGACAGSKQGETALRDGVRILAVLQMCGAEPLPEVVKIFAQIVSHGEARYPFKDVERAIESLMITFGNSKSLYAFGRTDGNGLNGPSPALTEVMRDIDSGWQSRIDRNRFGLAKRRRDHVFEARRSVSQHDRKDLRELGREIERAIGQVLNNYQKSLTHEQLTRIRADLYRVRAWIFPRHGEWKKQTPLRNDQVQDPQVPQGSAWNYIKLPSQTDGESARRHND